MTEATKKLIEMLYYDDYLYHLYIRSGRDKLVVAVPLSTGIVTAAFEKPYYKRV